MLLNAWASIHTPRGCLFDSPPGHMPRFQAWVQVGGMLEADVKPWCSCLFFHHPPSFSKIIMIIIRNIKEEPEFLGELISGRRCRHNSNNWNGKGWKKAEICMKETEPNSRTFWKASWTRYGYAWILRELQLSTRWRESIWESASPGVEMKDTSLCVYLQALCWSKVRSKGKIKLEHTKAWPIWIHWRSK